ncbi:hypothetical protein [uncultured Photobacterium sp.]|uniref:hypothetical protein n=1 Tax=uncultured Photobacterium sp. TaxID=173973 RepID=UPI0026235E60|nr:hypothetical protein [uncultured Photobacterium sp.]
MKKLAFVTIMMACANFNSQASDLALNELSHLSELQYGFDNYASVELDYALNSNVNIIQENNSYGQGNSALVKQSGENNSASIEQYGGGNIAYIHQYGSGNAAYVSEYGYSNYGVIKQYGNNNEATIIQEGGNHQGEITQYNDDNKALVVQKSNVEYFKTDITQSGGQTHVIINGMNKNITIR